MNIYLIAIAVLPVLVLAFVVYRQDKYEKEPIGKLIRAFIFGALAILPAVLMESMLSRFVPPIPIVSGAYMGFVVAGCSEELCKLLFLYWAIWKSQEFNEYFDGIVYGCFVALGFACFENLGYVLGQESFSEAMVTGSVRALLSVPGHFLFGVILGYFLSMAKFHPEKRGGYIILGLLLAMVAHGLFDWLLMVTDYLSTGLTILVYALFIMGDIGLWFCGILLIRKQQRNSLQQKNEAEAAMVNTENEFNQTY